jgi:hypothetical protein
MTARLITDSETGRLVAVSSGPIPVLDQTLDAGSHTRDFEALLGRRARELAMPRPTPPLTYFRRVAIEESLGWEDTQTAEIRREFNATLANHSSMGQREIDMILARRPELRFGKGRRGARAADANVCPTCDTVAPAGTQFCTGCGSRLTPGQSIFVGEQPGDTAGCPACGRNNPAGSSFCAACDRPIPDGGPVIQASSRPRRSISHGVRLVAAKSFRYIDRVTGKTESVKEGVTYCSSDAECYRVDPSAWVVA